MSIIKRLTTTLTSSIDQLVTDIENHDAVIQASLVDMRKKVAVARVRLQQLRQEEQRLAREAEAAQNKAAQWRERALTTGKSDETKAMACLQQRQQCLADAEARTREQAQYREAASALEADIRASEQQLHDMAQKHRLLRARQSSADAMHATRLDTRRQDTLQDSFERWEIRIAQDTALPSPVAVLDPLEQAFASQEQEIALKAELAALLASTATDSGDRQHG